MTSTGTKLMARRNVNNALTALQDAAGAIISPNGELDRAALGQLNYTELHLKRIEAAIAQYRANIKLAD